jgi:hypothetical protein
MCPALALRLIPAPALRTGLIGGSSATRRQITAGHEPL